MAKKTRVKKSSGAVQARDRLAVRSPSALLALGCFGLMGDAVRAGEAEPETQVHVRQLGTLRVVDSVDEGFNRSQVQSDRATAPLLDTPQTFTVISQELMRETGARTLTDVLANTPGISFSAGENGFGTSANNFTMRGFDSSGSVFIDNHRDSGSYTRDVFNVESVEVAKGAAADNGRGGAGGYVNMNTKQPGLQNFIVGDLSYGFDSYDSEPRQRVTVDINQTIGASTAVRLAAVYDDSGIPGRAVAENKVWGVAPSIAFGLGGALRGVLSWEHVERDDIPDWGVPGATMDLKGFDPAVGFNPLTEGAPRDGFYGLATDFDEATSDAILGRIEYDFSSTLTLSNQLRWARVDRQARYTTPNGFTAATLMVPTGTNFYVRENDSLGNITNLAARFDTGAVSHTVAAGVEFTRENSDADRPGPAVPLPGNTSVFDPNPSRVGAAPFNVIETASVRIDTLAFYLYDTLVINEQFQITGGLRGENYDVELGSRTAAGAPAGSADGFSYSEFAVNGKVGLVYKPVTNASIYASIGSSTQPPGSFLSNPDISRTGDNAFPGLVPDAKAMRSTNYEIGGKWDFRGGALSATAAIFRTETANVPVVGRDVPGGDPPGTNVLQGYHEQLVQGIELGLTGAITPEWNIFAGVLFSETERQISQAMDDARRAGASGAGDYGTATSTNGDSLSFTPDFSANLWTSYSLPFGLTLGGGLRHVGSQYMGRPADATRIIPNGRFGEVPAHTTLNAMAAYRFNDHVDVRLNVDNITDERYAASTNWAGSRATPGLSRSYLLSAGLRF